MIEKIKNQFKENYSDIIFVSSVIVIMIIILLIPSRFNQKNYYSLHSKATVINVNNDDLMRNGIVFTGHQSLNVKVKKLDDKIIQASNQLMGKLEFDNIFEVGDKVLVGVNFSDKGDIISATAIDYYRINIELILIILFVIILLIYAKWIGVKALISFLFTGIVIWKLLLPGILIGINPILLTLVVMMILTSIIIFLIAGLNKKGVVAFFGAFSGVIATCILALIFGKYFHINGAVKPFSETLLYSGFAHLQLSYIFLAGIFIASSGAVMDIAMDISASQNEIVKKKPNIDKKELIKSGFEVGKVVIGTMTTTLLFAYSGGFTVLLMLLIAQGTPIINILNLNYISADILHVIIGSFGLVLVAPLTAIIGGIIFVKK